MVDFVGKIIELNGGFSRHGADETGDGQVGWGLWGLSGQDPWLLQMKEKQAIMKHEEECFGAAKWALKKGPV